MRFDRPKNAPRAPSPGSNQAAALRRPRISRAGMYLMSAFVATLVLIVWVWWPLVRDYAALFDPQVPLWRQIDWLLIGIFAVMSVLIMVGADLRSDVWIVGVGLVGGLAIEGWGTQTHIWNYFTLERPPLWIIPAWPIASLSIDRLMRWMGRVAPATRGRGYGIAHAVIFGAFYLLMLHFVWPTRGMSLTQAALVICALIPLTTRDKRTAVLIFAAGAGLGYFLELWGTTRECWTYYTFETPPLFAVLAHGMASVVFWRAGLLVRQLLARIRLPIPLRVFGPSPRSTQRTQSLMGDERTATEG